MKRAHFLGFAVVLAAAVAALLAPPARASVSIAVTWTDLLARSSDAVVGVPGESRALWENGRIYTYTKVGVDRAIAGELHTGDQVWVRTMGGIVGDVGQRVEGEAVLSAGRASVLFLQPGAIGSYDVVARGQGQFPVVLDQQKTPKVIRSAVVGALVVRRGLAPVSSAATALAADRIHGRRLDDVAADVAAEWAHAHGR